jgi:thiamine-monophosphate kinase
MSIAFSNRFSLEALDEFYEGVYAACDKYNVDLIGGDTTTSQKGFIISVTAIGEIAPDKYVTRSGAQKADLLCVSGDLGGAFLGLTLLEREKKVFLETKGVQPDLENQDYIIGRILKPEARKDIIDFFAANNIMPTSMIDVSDGLSSEVLHLCKQSNVGCMVYEEKIPVNDVARQFAYKLELDPTACALSGGEDYELVFTVHQNDYDKIILNEQIRVIGYITDKEDGTNIMTKGGNKHTITAQGWNAFNK